MTVEAATPTTFIVTKEHRRFTEFADACRRDRYIGLCYGPPGVGKTLSARRHAHWDDLAPWLRPCRPEFVPRDPHPDWNTLFFTPTVHATPRVIDKELSDLSLRLTFARMRGLDDRAAAAQRHGSPEYLELLIIDEVDRLKMPALEQLRDHYDRSHFGMILIGMPGIEKRLARYPQLYSRVGFVHHYRPLTPDEQAFILTRHWPELSLDDPDDYTTVEALAAIARITGGNFRLTTRLVAQIKRILDINELNTVTNDVVQAARNALVIGTT